MMVRVFRSFSIFSMCGFLLFSTSFAHADSGLNAVIKEEARREFAAEQEKLKSKLDLWAEAAAKEASDFAKELKKTDPAANTTVNAEVVKQILSDENNAGLIKKYLEEVSPTGWKQTAIKVKALLVQKNLSLSDLSQNPKLISDFVSLLVKEERAFTELRLKTAEKSPVTEAPVELTPSGTLNQGLKLLKVLSSYVNTADLQVSDEAKLVKQFIAQ